ncbi:site-specific integrase [Adhaeribacter soli]|uniref:Site-specific integrase n=1 Tax=Adhaeribacter soli TaxID=2607655 RepID=A0A5N1J2U6_9BACT|nr:site-specific integrase [Adhaeribacter soli]KAA9338952.1 site-specific integrase [Adhaeribacter soli]
MLSKVILHNKDKNGLYSVYVQYINNGKIKRFPTGVKVAKTGWNEEKEQVKLNGTEDHKTDNTNIWEIKNKVDRIIKEHYSERGIAPTVDYVQAEYNDLNNVKGLKNTFFGYLDEFIELKRQSVTPNTLKGFKALKINLTEFQEQNKTLYITFEGINNVFLDKYKNFLISKKYHNTTVWKRIRIFKEFLNYYLKAEVHNNTKFKDYKFKAAKGNKEQVITLSLEELQKVKGIDFHFSKRLDYVRDLFLIQSFTGLRFSDVIRLSKANIKNGMITTNIEKTKTATHTLPLNSIVKELLEKYDYQLRKISNVKYNQYIKEVCSFVPELRNVETIIHYNGNETIKNEIERYKLITTHTARRNFVTVLFEKNVNPALIMKWTGHKSLNEFMKYLNTRQGEAAEIEKLTF